MASVATVWRLSARLASPNLAQKAAARGFRTSAVSPAAQNFTMPALSPTMTEGNIASWKVREGDSFSAGDVLLEIETDKASMDVEAQDDGILMKIMQSDGSKSVQVGTRIAVVAEPGDDIGQLEVPADRQDAPSKPAPQGNEPRAPAPQGAASEPPPPEPKKAGKPAPKTPKRTHSLLPSVEHLVREHKLDESAISEMTPSGPNGRLLKGDVLAYLGTVSANRPREISSRFRAQSHLDLRNIKIKPPAIAEAKKSKPAAPGASVPEELLVSLPVSLAAVVEVQKKIQDTLGTSVPLSIFVARAAELANDELPNSKNYMPTADELFNQVLGLDKVSHQDSRGHYVPQITALSRASFTGVAPKPKPAKVDVLDFLANPPAKAARRIAKTAASPAPSTGANTFSLAVPKDEERRAQVFLQRIKVALEKEPGRLVL